MKDLKELFEGILQDVDTTLANADDIINKINADLNSVAKGLKYPSTWTEDTSMYSNNKYYIIWRYDWFISKETFKYISGKDTDTGYYFELQAGYSNLGVKQGRGGLIASVHLSDDFGNVIKGYMFDSKEVPALDEYPEYYERQKLRKEILEPIIKKTFKPIFKNEKTVKSFYNKNLKF